MNKILTRLIGGCATLLCSCAVSGGYSKTDGVTTTEVYAQASVGKDSTKEKQTAKSHSSATSTESRSFRGAASGIVAKAALGAVAPAVTSLGGGAGEALRNVSR